MYMYVGYGLQVNQVLSTCTVYDCCLNNIVIFRVNWLSLTLKMTTTLACVAALGKWMEGAGRGKGGERDGRRLVPQLTSPTQGKKRTVTQATTTQAFETLVNTINKTLILSWKVISNLHVSWVPTICHNTRTAVYNIIIILVMIEF